MALLPPLLISTAMGLMIAFANMPPIMLLPTIMMSTGFPIANIINLSSQKKKYQRELVNRENTYKRQLEKERKDLLVIANQQRQILEKEYPQAEQALRIVMEKGENPRLWWRRPQDGDFMGLMIGKADGKASFTVIPPNYSDPFDSLTPLPGPVIKEFEMVSGLPFLINFQTFGSVGVTSTDRSLPQAAVWRLLLDLLVHHSPQDVHLAVLSDVDANIESWEWLKWAPHTAALTDERPRRLAFRPEAINDYLEWLVKEYDNRIRESRNSQEVYEDQAAEVVIFDDLGSFRQRRDLTPIIERGHEVGIYMIFIGNRNLPRVRCKLDIPDSRSFRCIETWQDGEMTSGEFEPVSLHDLQTAARTMAQLELASTGSNLVLPENVRLSQVLEVNLFSENEIRVNWTRVKKERELLHLPIGVCIGRDGYEPAVLNLLPEDKGGFASYHTIMIGYTGSGKSEFMKSLVMAAMYKYAPHELSFFFMDFKGGAAFNIFKDLPHETGIVTNLSPELVERGLDAIQNEIDSRQKKIVDAHVPNIWRYNQANQPPIAHLLIFLDEFARGLDEFPRLPGILQVLTRQGRSLGMYLFLANQDVNPHVDNLLANVGWRIALKVAKPEELHIIDKNLQPLRRAGHGYLRGSDGNILTIQAGYAGFPTQSSAQPDASEFRLSEISADGTRREIYRKAATQDFETSLTEEESLITLIKKVSKDLEIAYTPHIYLEPLPESIDLSSLLPKLQQYREYAETGWSESSQESAKLKAPLGIMDIPQKRLQEFYSMDFLDKDGHLWIIGSQDAGREMSITTILQSLALTHTPEEISYYIVELGSGQLRRLDCLPHTGAVIRANETERLDRLFNYLDQLMDVRTQAADEQERPVQYDPSVGGSIEYCDSENIFLVINNFLDLRKDFPELADRVIRYATDGKTAGIHLILGTNRGADLLRSVSDNIGKRFVLRLNTKDEYYDLIGQKVQQLSSNGRGRGYLADDGVAEVQVAETNSLKDLFDHMKASWRGKIPRPIFTMPECVSTVNLDTFLDTIPSHGNISGHDLLPIGVSWDYLDVKMVDILEERPIWLVTGSAMKGKSNVLAYLALKAAGFEEEWDIRVFTLRRSPIPELVGDTPRIWVTAEREAIIPEIEKLSNRLQTYKGGSKHTMVIIDDIGAAFEAGRESLKTSLDTLALQIRDMADIHLVASATIEDMRAGTATQVVKLLKQGNTGICFTNDPMILEMYGTSLQAVRPYQKIDLPLGRGFFISHSKLNLVQIPLIGHCR